MEIFAEMEKFGHEQVIFFQHKKTHLKGIIAIHDTTAGPALGGCRMRPYSSEDEMLFDVLRLSRGMTYKCAIADVDNGGGKCVLMGDPATDKTPEMFRALGRFVGGLGGRFYTGTDVGTYPQDFVHAKRETECIVGVPEEYGGSGDSSVPTALGVIQGIRATAKKMWNRNELKGMTFAIQGLGKVGAKVAQTLADEGCNLIVTDVVESNIRRLLEKIPTAKVVNPEDILFAECDILVPCALGAILNDNTIPKLRCKAIAGAANNQLLDEEKHGAMLDEMGILYAPDYLVNAGGLIQVADELHGANKERVLAKTLSIYNILLRIFDLAEAEHLPTGIAANRYVEERLETIMDLKSIRS